MKTIIIFLLLSGMAWGSETFVDHLGRTWYLGDSSGIEANPRPTLEDNIDLSINCGILAGLNCASKITKSATYVCSTEVMNKEARECLKRWGVPR
jgi:hypothetical protein